MRTKLGSDSGAVAYQDDDQIRFQVDSDKGVTLSLETLVRLMDIVPSLDKGDRFQTDEGETERYADTFDGLILKDNVESDYFLKFTNESDKHVVNVTKSLANDALDGFTTTPALMEELEDVVPLGIDVRSTTREGSSEHDAAVVFPSPYNYSGVQELFNDYVINYIRGGPKDYDDIYGGLELGSDEVAIFVSRP